MPAPTKQQLQPIVESLMNQNEIQGRDAQALAGALAEVIADALGELLSQATVAPGIPATPTATIGSGRLS